MSARAYARDDGPALIGRELSKAYARGKHGSIRALAGVSLEARRATLTALVGPDGAGKTTLLRLAAGLLQPDAGELHVLGFDVRARPQDVQDRISYMPQRFGLYEDLSVQENLDLYADLHGVAPAQRAERYPRLMEMTALAPFRSRLAGKLSGGMKQKLGLACTLVRLPELLLLDEPTVGVDPLSRRELWQIVHGLVERDGLSVIVSTSYLDEAAQCAHVIVLHDGRVLASGSPEQIRAPADGRTWLVAPAPGEPPRSLQVRLMQRADVIDAVPQNGRVRVVRLGHEAQAEEESRHEGKEASRGEAAAGAGQDRSAAWPHALQGEPVPARLEDGFMVLLRRTVDASAIASLKLDELAAGPSAASGPPPLSAIPKRSLNGRPATVSPLAGDAGSSPPALDEQAAGDEVIIEVRDLVRKFGDFTAVNRVSFQVRRAEVFGLLGPNGAGKTTTFRMLCGLLPATSGTLRVAGTDLRHARAQARQRIGYVAQKFSLYGDLSVRENLEFFAGIYGLRGARAAQRLDWALRQFELQAQVDEAAGALPGGFQRRLAMAAALLHEPQILFLDEPTSGVDPLARREFWARVTALAQAGTTVVVTTHFMEEAEYCDRIMIQDAGEMLAIGTPQEVRRNAGQLIESMEEAFIAIVERARRGRREAAP